MNEIELLFLKIASSRLILNPFPHLETNNVFSDCYLKDLLKYFPDDEFFDYAGRAFGMANNKRKDFWINDRNISNLPIDKYVFWSDFLRSMKTFVYPKIMSSYINQYVIPLSQNTGFKLQVRLVVEILPYVLQPHVDKDYKLATTVIYLPEDDCSNTDLPSLGTTLYENNMGFITKKHVKFTANCALTILRTNNSWHGGEWEQSLCSQRRTLQIFICKKDN
jgi:hypothetical protein